MDEDKIKEEMDLLEKEFFPFMIELEKEVIRLVPEFKRCMLDLEEKYDIRAVIHAALCYSILSLKAGGSSEKNILTYAEEILKQ